MGVFTNKPPTVIFLESIIGIVTLVWCLSFFADIFIDSFKADQINNIFMAVVGSGIVITTLANKAKEPTTEENQ